LPNIENRAEKIKGGGQTRYQTLVSKSVVPL